MVPQDGTENKETTVISITQNALIPGGLAPFIRCIVVRSDAPEAGLSVTRGAYETSFSFPYICGFFDVVSGRARGLARIRCE